jgi:hypothetical protein
LPENLSMNSFKGATAFNPPLFSLVNTLKPVFLTSVYLIIYGSVTVGHAFSLPLSPPPPAHLQRLRLQGQLPGGGQGQALRQEDVKICDRPGQDVQAEDRA